MQSMDPAEELAVLRSQLVSRNKVLAEFRLNTDRRIAAVKADNDRRLFETLAVKDFEISVLKVSLFHVP